MTAEKSGSPCSNRPGSTLVPSLLFEGGREQRGKDHAVWIVGIQEPDLPVEAPRQRLDHADVVLHQVRHAEEEVEGVLVSPSGSPSGPNSHASIGVLEVMHGTS